MNKKIKLIIGTLFLFLIAGLIWFSIPEYGDSYSERQRRYGNDYVLYSEMMLKERPESPLWPDFSRGEFGDIVSYWSKNEERSVDYEKFYGRWSSECEELRKSSDLFWSPLQEEQREGRSYSGMPDLLLKKKADYGDMTASLHLVWRYLKHERDYEVNSRVLARKYLSRLEEAGIEGVSYLKKLHSEYIAYSENKTDPSRLPGYNEFLRQMDQGNYLFYRIVDLLVKSNREAFLQEPYNRLKVALKNKADLGEAVAYRDLSLLLLSQKRLLWKIEKEMHRETILTRIGKSFPDWIPFPRYSHSETRDEVFERERDLIKCGEAGDDEAKDAWVNYFMARRGFWKKQDWARAIQWTDDLQKKGYVPMCREILLFLELDRSISVLVSRKSHIKVYSSSQDEEKIAELRKYLYGKGCIETLVDDFYKRKWTVADEKEFRYVIDSIALWNSSRLIPYNFKRGYGDNIAPELFPVLLPVLEKSAAEGNMDVIVFLIREYGRGKYLPADRGKAQFWAKVAREKKKDILSSYLRRMNWFELDVLPLDPLEKFLEFKELGWCLEYAEERGNGVGAADVLEKLNKFEEELDCIELRAKSRANWMRGRLYEKGIGVTKDYQKALEYYVSSISNDDYLFSGEVIINPITALARKFVEIK